MNDPNNRSTPFEFASARIAALDWFEKNGRSFPWRDNPTPYRVWISEVMLQQTTTQTVLGYFERFLNRFPDARALADASEEETLKYWEGLGYYRRAKMLRAAAIEIVNRFNGVFPEKYEDVLSLPGIGRYASGAILSFGFNKRFPILEANTTRLHARLIGLREETTLATSQKILWNFAEEWLPEQESPERVKNVYRKLNGALTDLGRLVCSPADPNCDKCPLCDFCVSYRLRLQAVVPVLKKKQNAIRRVDVALWISRSDLPNARNVKDFRLEREKNTRKLGNDARVFPPKTDVLLALRPKGVLWEGLWEFPRFEAALHCDLNERALRNDFELRDRIQFFLEEEAGATAKDRRIGRVLTTIRHAVTRYRVALGLCKLAESSLTKQKDNLFDFETNDEQAFIETGAREKTSEKIALNKRQAKELRWVPIDALDELPLSSPARKIATFIVKETKK